MHADPTTVPTTPATVYVALGSNLGDRLATLRSATRMLRDGVAPGTRLLRCSPVYETRPLGPASESYLNAVVELRTCAEPVALLAALQGLELRHGRTRRERWEARTLDLDLLVWEGPRGSVELAEPGLRLPHPELERRDFVLAPLVALAPELRPGGRAGAGPTAVELLAALPAGVRTIVAQLDELLC